MLGNLSTSHNVSQPPPHIQQMSISHEAGAIDGNSVNKSTPKIVFIALVFAIIALLVSIASTIIVTTGVVSNINSLLSDNDASTISPRM